MINHPPNRHGYSPIFMQMPFLSYSIRGWLSDSGSFIQLPTSLKEANCGDDLEVTAIFTAPFGDYDVFYQVILCDYVLFDRQVWFIVIVFCSLRNVKLRELTRLDVHIKSVLKKF